MKSRLAAFLVLALQSVAFADLKSTNRMTVAGQIFNNTVLMKQGKIRNETNVAPGISTVTIQDCGSHRMIQLNDHARTFMLTDISEAPQASADASSGTVTVNVHQHDTGERKQLFGYTARHIKGTISSQGSGSCAGNFQLATDGWYIDLPAAEGCVSPEREMLRSRMERSGCNDRTVVKTTGIEKLGYPVLLDTTIDDKGNPVSIHQETTDLSITTLDPSLFEIPAGYKEVHSYRDLIGIMPFGNAGAGLPREPRESPSSTGASQRSASDFGLGTPSTSAVDKKKGVLRIGVTQVASGVEASLATDGWQQELVNDINLLGGQGVVLSIDPYDREAALETGKEQECDYVLFTKITNFKTASVGEKLGKVFNRGGGAGGTGQGRIDITSEVKVFQPGSSVLVFGGTANFRQNDADSTWKGLMRVEAREVMLQLKKLQEQK